MKNWRGLALPLGMTLAVLAAAVVWLWPVESVAPSHPHEAAPTTLYPDIPRIDVHVHVAPSMAEEAASVLANNHVRLALNASGGTPGAGLELSRQKAETTGGRLQPYCNLALARLEQPSWEGYVKDTLFECKNQGAVGLKIFKSLGLGIQQADGRLVRVDDPRLDIVFEEAGRLGLPVLIHSGDPRAFFDPVTPENERYAELMAHPSWSFHGSRANGLGDWPTWEEVFQQFRARVLRHRETSFIGAHFGNAPEDPDRVAELLKLHPRFFIETGARIPEIGRHDPKRMRKLFEEHQDRILFGTDFAYTTSGLTLGSSGAEPDRPERIPFFFGAHWRYFETKDRGFPHPTPIQGDWTIDGLGLDRAILEKIYWRNAASLFGLELPK